MSDRSINHRKSIAGFAIVTIGLSIGLATAAIVLRAVPLSNLVEPGEISSRLMNQSRSDPDIEMDGVPVTGQRAPNFTLRTLDNGDVALSDLRGQAVLINFWATWCGPCRLEMPELVRVYERFQTDGFIILAINLTAQDSLSDVEAFAEEFQLPFPVLLDEAGLVSTDLYQLRGLPTSVFVDRNGVIDRIYLGAMTGEQIEEFVQDILK